MLPQPAFVPIPPLPPHRPSLSNLSDLDIIQSELCKKDTEFVLKAESEEIKDVKKNPTMKLSTVFHSTYAKARVDFLLNCWCERL